MDHCGILYNAYDEPTDTFSPAQVPLEEVAVKVWIVDVTARVTITQRFYNSLSTRTGRAKYCFPVPASAAVCAFQLTGSDGRVIKGECKEKELAQEQYEAAMATGQTAGLLEYVTDDIFTISIGHIPPYTVLETHLVYTMTLYTGDYMDQVRFQLPSYVGERYGIPPEGLEAAVQPARDRTRIAITADIQMSGRIQDVLSTSHPSQITETRYATHVGRASRRRTTIRYQSTSYLDRDFILVIRAKDLDKPRCFVEVRKDAQYPDSIALQLTMVPRTKLPATKAQRYLFVVDRSASMEGDRIEMAKRTLVMMLRMIPAEGSTFNIFGFGFQCVPWRPTNEPYTQHALEEATKYVEGIQADMGGTEIREALNKVFATSPPDISTVVFVLTDGDANDVDGTKADVARFVKFSHVLRRVFTLGIGDEVSTDMCEGIARAGNGECLLAVDTESIVQKCSKLFTASRTPFVRNISLDWGVSDSGSPLGAQSGVTFSNQPSPRSVATRPLPPVQQTPYRIEAIHSGTRMNIFAIITSRHAKPPRNVILSGVLDDDTNRGFELRIAVQQIALVDSDDGSMPLIHTMAAWRLIQEYTENPSMPLPRPLGVATEDELRQSVIVQLGVQYQVASQHTSFVAIEGTRDSRTGLKLKRSFIQKHPEYEEDESDPGSEDGWQGPLDIGQLTTQLRAAWHGMTSTLAGLSLNGLWSSFNANFRIDGHRQGEQGGASASVESLPGQWPGSGGSSSAGGSGDDGRARPGTPPSDQSSIRTFSTLSSLAGWSRAGSGDSTSSGSEGDDDDYRAPSPTFQKRVSVGGQSPRQMQTSLEKSVIPTVVVDLVKLQQFNGSFSPMNLDSIRPIVGDGIIEEARRLNEAESDVWVTVVCVAFLKKQLEHNPELLNNLLVKPLEFLRSRTGVDVDALLERAITLLQ